MKRLWGGLVLLGLGAFLVAAATVALAWAPDVVKKTPLDVDKTTYLDGTVRKLDPTTGKLVENPVMITSITEADSDRSDSGVVVFVNTQCVVIDVDNPADCVSKKDRRLINAATDVFATDRVTGMAIDSDHYLPADAVAHEGLVNKWPFDAQKKTYPYWDGIAGRAVDAVYDRTESLDGLSVYVYTTTVRDAPIEILPGVRGTYDDSKEIWIEPRTGDILNIVDNQQRYLDDDDKTQVLDLQYQFTDAQQRLGVEDARANIRSLDLVTRWIPITGFVGGPLCAAAGLVLLLSRRRVRRDEEAPARPAVTV